MEGILELLGSSLVECNIVGLTLLFDSDYATIDAVVKEYNNSQKGKTWNNIVYVTMYHFEHNIEVLFKEGLTEFFQKRYLILK